MKNNILLSHNLKTILSAQNDGYKVPKKAELVGREKLTVMYKNKGLVHFYITTSGEWNCSTDGLGASQFDFIRDAWSRIK